MTIASLPSILTAYPRIGQWLTVRADGTIEVRSGKVDLAPFITGRIRVDDIVEQGFQQLITNKDNEVKILVSM